MNKDLPYEYDEEEEADESALDTLKKLCLELAKQEIIRDQQARNLRETEAQIKALRERLIPETMDRAGVTSIGMAAGLSVTVKDTIHASLPKDHVRRQRALELVRKTGNEGLIKTSFQISFGRNAAQHAERLKKLLAESGIDGYAEVSCDETIHHSTYKKFVREIAETNPDIELEVLGGFRKRIAETKI